MNIEKKPPILSLAIRSIENQDPSWKNALTRKLISKLIRFRQKMPSDEALEEYRNDQNKGFWYSKKGRQIVNAIIFFVGYILIGETIQHMNPTKYNEFARSLTESFNRIGLVPDTDFFRWQISDFFGAGYYTFCATLAAEPTLKYFGEKEIFGKDSEWWDDMTERVAAFTTGVILTTYEVLQAHMSHKPIDHKDIVAYIAGLGLYLSSEEIWKKYQLFKKKYGF